MTASLIRLAYWSGLSQSEIAVHVGIPLGTVKTQTQRAPARLAELLERDALSGASFPTGPGPKVRGVATVRTGVRRLDTRSHPARLGAS
jgi:hypothetical protein